MKINNTYNYHPLHNIKVVDKCCRFFLNSRIFDCLMWSTVKAQQIVYTHKIHGFGSLNVALSVEPRQANLCLRAFRHDKF